VSNVSLCCRLNVDLPLLPAPCCLCDQLTSARLHWNCKLNTISTVYESWPLPVICLLAMAASRTLFVGCEVFTAVVMKSINFWDIMPDLAMPPTCLLVSCWNYSFDPEDGGDMFLRNVGWHSTDYPALYPRSWYSSELYLYLCCVVFIGSACSEHCWRYFLKTTIRLFIPSRNVTKFLGCFIVVCMGVDGFLTLSFKVVETSSSLFISSPVARGISFAAYKGIRCFIGLPTTEVCLGS
jgi:hypothetical protein